MWKQVISITRLIPLRLFLPSLPSLTCSLDCFLSSWWDKAFNILLRQDAFRFKGWAHHISLSYSPRSVCNQNFNCAAHKQYISYELRKKIELEPAITWKLVYLSADNFKKYLTSMGRHLSPRYGQVILVSGYPVLTAVNWSKHWCPICVHYQFSCAPKLVKVWDWTLFAI